MGYRPNQLARSLRQQSSRTVGVLLDDIGSEWASLIIKGVEESCRSAGYQFVIWSTHRQPASEQEALEAMGEMQVDGIILADTWYHTGSEPPEIHLPVVFLNRSHEGGSLHCIEPDGLHDAAQVTRHLLELGHRRIGFIGGPSQWRSSPERLKGYQLALLEAGIPFDPELVVEGDWSAESGQAGATRLLSLRAPPTAIFAANDYMALGAIDAAHQQRLQVPGDLSVAGYDNRAFAAFCRPRLTTISLPLYEMGLEAARRLLALIGNPDLSPGPVIVRGQLFRRDSAAPPPAERIPTR